MSIATLSYCTNTVSPVNISGDRIDGIANLLRKASKGHHSFETTRRIKDLALSSIGDESTHYAFEIRMVIDSIRFLQAQVSSYDDELKNLVGEQCPKLLTIPGVGYVTASFIIGEIGDVSSFFSPYKLLAFAGLDPTVYQSGKYSATNVTISKRGSSYLRWAIHQIACIIIHKDPTFTSYYLKKRSEGKHHLVALGHVCKKLIRVINSLLTYYKEFIPQS